MKCTAVSVTTTTTSNTIITTYDDVGQQTFAVVKSASSCIKTRICLIQFPLFASPNQLRGFNSLCLSVRLFNSYC